MDEAVARVLSASVCSYKYNQQQNKWHPQICLLTNFEATLDFNRIGFTYT